METSQDIFRKIDFDSLFKAFNKGKKRKLTTADKKKFKLLLARHIPVTSGDVANLTKALEAGPATYGLPPKVGKLYEGARLQVEDLDATMKLVTYSNSSIKLWKNLAKNKKGRKNVK